MAEIGAATHPHNIPHVTILHIGSGVKSVRYKTPYASKNLATGRTATTKERGFPASIALYLVTPQYIQQEESGALNSHCKKFNRNPLDIGLRGCSFRDISFVLLLKAGHATQREVKHQRHTHLWHLIQKRTRQGKLDS